MDLVNNGGWDEVVLDSVDALLSPKQVGIVCQFGAVGLLLLRVCMHAEEAHNLVVLGRGGEEEKEKQYNM